ncbi:dehydrogenase/reductase SDR family member on chromosome X-like isoform X3 [Ostrea edulis]|uniref:dehydrogenase/reductase SDR family member on chromosome X-like isoform X3 n=1 Tax=Ostrea edulis TaxID=37623 RepID=UPI0024AF116F|nr:dehydrogenase/reductase SDR family member on chromosome X-like isoform X3 [Ostrea edulis]
MGGSESLPEVALTMDRVVLITGGNTGIGYETAKWIAMRGARVIIACRSEERANAVSVIKKNNAIERMQVEFKEEKSKGTPRLCSCETLALEFMALDLASLKSVENFIDNFKAKEIKLHVLLCNAGIALHAQEYTEDGFEIMFQVNYLGHFLLVAKLLPLMLNSGEDCRLIFVSSEAYRASSFDLDKAQGKHHTKENFKRIMYYANSKLYQIMQMYVLNRQLQKTNVTVNSLHPGIVETEITRSFTDLQAWKVFLQLAKLVHVTKTPFEGAKTSITAAVNPQFKATRDAFFYDMKISQTNNLARDQEKQEALWRYSVDSLKDFIKTEDMKYLEEL